MNRFCRQAILSGALIILAGSFSVLRAQKPATAGQGQTFVIKGQETAEPSVTKPLCDIPVDPYETLRPSLEPDPSLLLAQSPAIETWTSGQPVVLNNSHLLQPWDDILIEEVETIRLQIRTELQETLGRPVGPADNNGISWKLSIVNEDGQLLKRFKGNGLPPENLAWNGRTDQGKWLAAGHDYSAIYVFRNSDGQTRTQYGQPIRLPALTHHVPEGIILSLDTSVLFGAKRDQPALVEPEGQNLLRAAADLVRRQAYGAAIEVRLFGTNQALAQQQAIAVKNYLVSEMTLPPGKISIKILTVRPSEARLDLLLRTSL